MTNANCNDVHKAQGPILLLAGPGTGKTYQLAKRIKFLVEEQKVNPSAITVITFTAAAAANMRSRISDPKKVDLNVLQALQPDLICTMHSLGYRIIRENHEILKLSDLPNVVQVDRTKFILMCDAAQMAGYNRQDANEVKICRQYGNCQPNDSKKCKICNAYRSILQSSDAIDYDDQILLACHILKENHDVAEDWRKRAFHLLVDEYQDINAGQFELINILSKGQENGLFVVGDDDQSIYSWRGGSPEFIRRFKYYFGQYSNIKALHHSYRCPRNVLESAFSIVKHYDKSRLVKGEFTYEINDGNPITVHNTPSSKKEAKLVQKIVRESLPSKEVLILVPDRGYTKIICEQLRKYRISFIAPEPLPGEGLPIIERFITWFKNISDNLALRECIENMLDRKGSPVPSRSVRKDDKRELREKGFGVVSNLWNTVTKTGKSLWEILNENDLNDEVLHYLKDGLNRLKQTTEDKKVPPMLSCLADNLQPWKSVDALMDEIQTWVSRIDQGIPGQNPNVRVMTFQGAKGLEAEVVCIIGAEEGGIPRDTENEDQLAEHARLFLVSMTRAKNDLHIFHTRNRPGAVTFKNIHNSEGQHFLKKSRFLEVLPKELIKSIYIRSE